MNKSCQQNTELNEVPLIARIVRILLQNISCPFIMIPQDKDLENFCSYVTGSTPLFSLETPLGS
jgi:hypothetical protein